MANNLIRVKQLDQSELSGFFAQAAVNSGIIPSIVNSIGTGIFVSVSGDQNVSGIKTFFNSINISGDLTVNGSIRANEIIDFTVTGDISGYTGQFQALYVKGEPVVTGFAVLLYGDQTISGIKTFDDDINISGDLTLNGGLYINNLEEINISGTILNSGIRLANLNDLTATGSVLYTYITELSGVSVLTYENQTISGVKTFSNTGSFNTLQITNKKLSSYSLNSTNFIFGDNYLNFTNSSSNLTGILPSGIVSGINYYAKNLNSGIFFISGSGSRTIDGFSTLNLYKNESVQLVGVNTVGYTGWVTISADGGIS